MWNMNVPCKYTTYDTIIHIDNNQLSHFHRDNYLVLLKVDNSFKKIHINLHIIFISQNTYKSANYSNKIVCMPFCGKDHPRFNACTSQTF